MALDKRLHALAELTAAPAPTVNTASRWVRLSRQWRLTDEEFLALPSYQTGPPFSELDKLVLDYAVGMSRTPVDVSDVLLLRC
jgi:hypothetical protein